MAKRKATSQPPRLTGDQRFQRSMLFIERGADTARVLIQMGALVMIVLLGTEAIGDLAGKKTFADIGIRFLASVKVSEALAWIFGGSGIIYGAQQKRLRRREAKRMGRRLEYLEKQIDPGRSSSEPPEEPGDRHDR